MSNANPGFRVRFMNARNTIFRTVNRLRRPSKSRNIRLLHQRGEDMQCFVFREAIDADIHAIAAVHVSSWNDTFKMWGGSGPSLQLRENQWREIFRSKTNNWFCIVIENNERKLVGFAKGDKYNHSDLPDYCGELKHIYLLRNYQRLGLGRQLVALVAQRFLSQGINSMVLFGIPQNPACSFYEAIGGQRLLSAKGAFHGGYGWKDLSIFKT